MRAMWMTAAGVVACFTLFGCDRNQQQAQTVAAAPVAVAPPPSCNCQQAAAAPHVTVAHHRYRGRHHGHSLSEFLAYSTGTSESTSETHTVREYRPGDEERYSAMDSSETHEGQVESRREMRAEAHVWVDGYGKAHYADYGPLDDEHPGLISRKDERERMRPYRGYDSKCENGID